MLSKLVKLLCARSVVMLVERFYRLGAGAIVTFIVARWLGESALGTYGVVMVWLAFLAPLTNLGLNNLVQKMAHSQTDPIRLQQYLQTAMWLRLAAGLVCGGAMALGFSLFYPHYFNQGPWSITLLFLLQSFFAFILFEYEQNYHGHFRAVALAKIAIATATLAARVIGLWYGLGVEWLFLIVGLEFFATGVVQYVWYRRYCPTTPQLSVRYFDAKIASELLSRASWIWLASVLSVIYLKIDTVMIEAMMGVAAAGQYTAVARISELWYVIPVTLAARYYPQMLKTYAQGWPDYLRLVRRHGGMFFSMALVISIGMTLSAYWIMLLAYGEAFTKSTLVLQIHVWAGCFVFVRSLISQHLIIAGLERLSMLSHGVGALINIGLNYLLIPRFGLEGAAWATLISYAYASFFFIFFARTTRQHFFEMCRLR